MITRALRKPRRSAYYESDHVRCLACSQPIRRFELLSGHVFATCDHKVRRPGSQDKQACGCHLHIVVMAGEGLCRVTELTTEEHAKLKTTVARLTAREVFKELGMIGRVQAN